MIWHDGGYCSPNSLIRFILESSRPMFILCVCQQVFFKMDANGNGQEVVLDHVFSCDTRVPSFRHFNKDLFTGYSQFLTLTHLR